MRLILPLHSYDEAGVIKPPAWLYWMTGLACVDWLLVLFALALPSQTETLLHLFYPQRGFLLIKLTSTLPMVVALSLISQRQRLWNREHYLWRWSLVPLLLAGNIGSISLCVVQLLAAHWQFHWLLACTLVLQLIFLTLIMRSQHLRLMVADWSRNNLAH